MFTAIFRVIAAVPFAFLCKIALIHYCQGSFRKWIIIEILTLALGVMMFPSFKMGWSSGVLYISMNVCYYSRSSITRGLWGVAGLISYYGIQSYKSDSLGYLDTKILKLAARAANALCA
jgi:hypothetical protein